jgi:hypothetical protein
MYVMILKLTSRARAISSSFELYKNVSSSRRKDRDPSQDSSCWLGNGEVIGNYKDLYADFDTYLDSLLLIVIELNVKTLTLDGQIYLIFGA